MKKIPAFALLFLSASLAPLSAQAPAFDTSGNGQLNGTYYFRHVIYVINDSPDQYGIVGDVNEAISLYGQIVFDGSGDYTINNGRVLDSGVGVSQTLQCYLEDSPNPNCTDNNGVTGTYSISASGYGYLANPIVSGDLIYGLVAGNGIFSGSSTETQQAYNDMFIAGPVPSPVPTGFSGSSYTAVGYLPFNGGNSLGADFSFQINPNGSQNLGSVTIGGYAEGNGSTQISQTSNVTYSFSSGAAVLSFPTNNSAVFYPGGQLYLYFSQDGNFFFGGSPQGFDIVVGVSDNTAGDSNFGACNGGTSCLYYQSGLDLGVGLISDTSCDQGYGCADADSYFGSLNATNSGTIISHQRISDTFYYGATYAWTLNDTFNYPASGAYTDAGQSFNYWVGDNGAVRIGQGTGAYLGINLALEAPVFTPTGSVWINPTGIVNAAGFAPFTAGVSNGEFIVIYGQNLSSGGLVQASTVPFPVTLNNVQVMINGVAAPLYYVSSGQIAAIVPSGNPYALVQVQVVNNGTPSNIVTTVEGSPGSSPVNEATPGIYTYLSQGVYAAAVDVSANPAFIVTPSNPAQPNDIVEVFMAGLGEVYPTVPDGAAPPISPLSYTDNTVTADLDGTPADVGFAGLAPTLAGLYQVNVTIPSTIGAGDHFLDISVSNPNTAPGAFPILQTYDQQALISVGGGTAARPSESISLRRKARSHSSAVTRRPFCGHGSKGCVTPTSGSSILQVPSSAAVE